MDMHIIDTVLIVDSDGNTSKFFVIIAKNTIMIKTCFDLFPVFIICFKKGIEKEKIVKIQNEC